MLGGMEDTGLIQVVRAVDTRSVAIVRELFREYADSLDFSLDFQDFEREVRGLPGEYAAPQGALLLAWVEGDAAGCVGVRPIDPTTCEMKRLYVRPEFRVRGVGRVLAERAVEEGRNQGYERMRLDTVPSLRAAITLYRSMGFTDIAPYRENPVPGALFLERRLR